MLKALFKYSVLCQYWGTLLIMQEKHMQQPKHEINILNLSKLSLFLTEMTPVTSSSSEMMNPRPAEDAKYMKLFFPGFPSVNTIINIKTMAQFCKYWTCVMFVIIAISSIHWLVFSHKLSVSVTELPSAANLPICILLSSEVKVFFNVFFAGFPSSASLLELETKSIRSFAKISQSQRRPLLGLKCPSRGLLRD